MTYLSVFVPGKPAPQGSKRAIVNKGGKVSMIESSKSVKPWRADVRDTVSDHLGPFYATAQPGVAVGVELNFVLPRPVSTPKKASLAHVKRPDVDKLARAVLDALSSAGVWVDDSQVSRLVVTKRLAMVGEKTGCFITVEDSADQRDAWSDVKADRSVDAAEGRDT